MIRRKRLRWLYYLSITSIILLVGYKVYLNVFEQDFEAVHTRQIDRIQETLAGRDSFRFAVVGNVNNSVGIFERKIIPRLNAAEIDFVISAGNAVSGGGEDKYRAVHRTLGNLQVPYVLTFGDNEHSALGSFRFYEHYGPYFHAFSVGDSRLIFLDTTGKTSPSWQLRWLRNELADHRGGHVFVFMGHPLYRPAGQTLLDAADDYLENPAFRQGLIELLQRYPVDAVFAANAPRYDLQKHSGTSFITTGGAGGLVLNKGSSFYHYVTVEVTPQNVELAVEQLDIGQHGVFKFLEGLWFFIHSLFYVGYLNSLLMLSVLLVIALKLQATLFAEHDYYRRYDLDPGPYLQRPLRVAMFTNNYLPFIGGVPLSIERLRQGLQQLGNSVLVVAPRYGRGQRENGVLRVPSLLNFGIDREFRMANIFLPRIRRRLKAFHPDLIHVHHPFWLGSLGLWLGRRLRVPVVYTYHTRLEHYAHFVPLPGLLFRNLISHYLIKRFANRCDGVIVPTYSAEEYLRIIGVRTPIHIQPTGIDYQRFQQILPGDVLALRERLALPQGPVLVSVSRLSTEKNIDFLIDAVHRLQQSMDQPFTLLMIGDGHERERVQQRIDALGLQDAVRLLGAVAPEEIPLYYRLGDLFVFASQSETQGMVILEAMAAGLPVVAVRSSGIDDVVQEGVNGFKTLPEPSAWARRVRQLLTDQALRRQLGAHARDFARDYSLTRVATRTKAIYAELLAAQAQPAQRGSTEPATAPEEQPADQPAKR